MSLTPAIKVESTKPVYPIDTPKDDKKQKEPALIVLLDQMAQQKKLDKALAQLKEPKPDATALTEEIAFDILNEDV